MKKIIQNFYIFSKFLLSFTLLICLLGTLYIFYKSYQKEKEIVENQISFDEQLKDEISNNTKLINQIAKELKLNETSLNEIKKNIKSLIKQDKNINASSLSGNIELLNENFKSLSEEIENLKLAQSNKSTEQQEDKGKVLDKNKNEIIDLIMFKYENNMKFNQDLEYLNKIVGNNDSIDKISILSIKPFKGFNYLNEIYDKEVNIFLKKMISNDPDSLFNKIILPYLSLSPTSENVVTSDVILKIKEIESQIKNKNLENVLQNLETINRYETEFKSSLLEIDKYLKFKNELYSLK